MAHLGEYMAALMLLLLPGTGEAHWFHQGQNFQDHHSAISATEANVDYKALFAVGLEPRAAYRLRLAAPMTANARQQGGWYLGARHSPRSDRDNSSLYVHVLQPGAVGFKSSNTEWILRPSSNPDYVRITQPNGWYLTSRNSSTDLRDGNSSYTIITSGGAAGLPEQDGEWQLEKDRWGAFRLTLRRESRYLTAHRYYDRDIRGNSSTFACVVSNSNKVPTHSDGRWILEKVTASTSH
eukprot:CAMPEP_0170575998 /NCGR_PEP_ID=MMETSP0224-20130122/4160_1 /TAXON_ID=285029 /ORGANISM="Togula jolla, Strain CCCM 725" /LENGTH=237 /DNA_ID=CAMNT_0010898815 /DNA_START=70 /DNA_END=783 /DNA_ORIENTATION=+